MKTCKEKAIEWCVSERTLNYYCQSGKIKNAKITITYDNCPTMLKNLLIME